MHTLKGAIGDYLNDNFNKNSSAQFLKKNGKTLGISVPLTENQIKVTKRDQVFVKSKATD